MQTLQGHLCNNQMRCVCKKDSYPIQLKCLSETTCMLVVVFIFQHNILFGNTIELLNHVHVCNTA